MEARMTAEEIRATIARMTGVRRVLRRLEASALAGDAGARFVVYAARRRQKGVA